MLWIIEGEKYLRFHDGDCWMLHSSGAFQGYKGVPTDSGRVQAFLLALEGLFRRLPEDVERNPDDLLTQSSGCGATITEANSSSMSSV